MSGSLGIANDAQEARILEEYERVFIGVNNELRRNALNLSKEDLDKLALENFKLSLEEKTRLQEITARGLSLYRAKSSQEEMEELQKKPWVYRVCLCFLICYGDMSTNKVACAEPLLRDSPTTFAELLHSLNASILDVFEIFAKLSIAAKSDDAKIWFKNCCLWLLEYYSKRIKMQTTPFQVEIIQSPLCALSTRFSLFNSDPQNRDPIINEIHLAINVVAKEALDKRESFFIKPSIVPAVTKPPLSARCLQHLEQIAAILNSNETREFKLSAIRDYEIGFKQNVRTLETEMDIVRRFLAQIQKSLSPLDRISLLGKDKPFFELMAIYTKFENLVNTLDAELRLSGRDPANFLNKFQEYFVTMLKTVIGRTLKTSLENNSKSAQLLLTHGIMVLGKNRHFPTEQDVTDLSPATAREIPNILFALEAQKACIFFDFPLDREGKAPPRGDLGKASAGIQSTELTFTFTREVGSRHHRNPSTTFEIPIKEIPKPNGEINLQAMRNLIEGRTALDRILVYAPDLFVAHPQLISMLAAMHIQFREILKDAHRTASNIVMDRKQYLHYLAGLIETVEGIMLSKPVEVQMSYKHLLVQLHELYFDTLQGRTELLGYRNLVLLKRGHTVDNHPKDPKQRAPSSLVGIYGVIIEQLLQIKQWQDQVHPTLTVLSDAEGTVKAFFELYADNQANNIRQKYEVTWIREVFHAVYSQNISSLQFCGTENGKTTKFVTIVAGYHAIELAARQQRSSAIANSTEFSDVQRITEEAANSAQFLEIEKKLLDFANNTVYRLVYCLRDERLTIDRAEEMVEFVLRLIYCAAKIFYFGDEQQYLQAWVNVLKALYPEQVFIIVELQRSLGGNIEQLLPRAAAPRVALGN